jgi:trk system potassium uptake protein TrkA
MFFACIGTVTLAVPFPASPPSLPQVRNEAIPLVDRIPHDAPVLVVGLGRFGAATAGQLDRLGREVLAVDADSALVQKWSERITHAVQADARNIEALRQVGAQDFSIAVVAVGSSIEASVLITANLVDLKVPQIWAKAISQSHGKILARIGANHVIYPEAEAGERVAHLVSGRMLDFIEFDDGFALVKMYPPKPIRGIPLSDSLVRKKYNVTVVGVKAPGKNFTYAERDTVVSNHDLIIVSGTSADIEKFASLQS